jgi:uncharacterized membrane protein YccC
MQGQNTNRGVTGTVFHGIVLSVLCVISYWLVTHILSRAIAVSHDDDLLAGMWAVVATIFVYRYAYEDTIAAALSRIGATLMSFMLCLAYLAFFPFSVGAMAMLIGIGTVLMIFLRRRDDVITTGITTAVVMVVAAISPQHAWKQPILRLVDTIVGTGVGILGALITSPSRGRRVRMSPDA